MAWRTGLLGACALLVLGCGDDSTSSDGDGTTGTTGPDAPTSSGMTPGTTETGEDATATAADSTGSTSAMTTRDGTSTDTGDTESDSSGSGTTGEPLGDCYDDHPFSGSLCGPPDAECVVVADEVVDPQSAFRNDAPAITVDDACRPQILYSVAQGGFSGYFARRSGDDDWQVDETPFAYATGGLTYDAVEFRTLAVPYDGGDAGTSIWSWDGAWVEEDDMAGNWLTRAAAVDGVADGSVHFGTVNTGTGEFVTWTWPGFDFYSVQDSVERGAVAIGTNGVPHTVVWSTFSGTWGLYWSDGTEVATGVAPLGSGVLERGEIRIGMTPEAGPGGTGVAHILFAQDTPGPQHGLRYATPAEEDGWTVLDVVDEDPAGTYCDVMPTFEGEMCDYDYTVVRALGVVASEGGDVRLLYSEDHLVGTLVAACMMIGGGPPSCEWEPMSDETTSQVMIAWPDGKGVTSTAVAEGPPLTGATVELGPDGVIHLAGYADNTDGTTVRYLALSM